MKKTDLIQREKELLKIIDDILWMAIRYAHGRHTCAPYIIRDVVKKLKEIYPDFKLKNDITIIPPTKDYMDIGVSIRTDWLDDLFKKENNE